MAISLGNHQGVISWGRLLVMSKDPSTWGSYVLNEYRGRKPETLNPL